MEKEVIKNFESARCAEEAGGIYRVKKIRKTVKKRLSQIKSFFTVARTSYGRWHHTKTEAPPDAPYVLILPSVRQLRSCGRVLVLDASSHLYDRLTMFVSPSVGP